ncbi:MAG: hypothetical protein AB7S59_09855 [Parvibaculaceae bacterium]
MVFVTTISPAQDGRAYGGPSLVAEIGRERRRAQAKALALIAPLFLFLLLVFVVPIALLLTRAVDNREVSGVLRATAAALAGWDGKEVPPEAAFAALVEDFRGNPREDVAEVAKRLN